MDKLEKKKTWDWRTFYKNLKDGLRVDFIAKEN